MEAIDSERACCRSRIDSDRRVIYTGAASSVLWPTSRHRAIVGSRRARVPWFAMPHKRERRVTIEAQALLAAGHVPLLQKRADGRQLVAHLLQLAFLLLLSCLEKP